MFSYVNDPKTTLGWNMAHSVRDPRLQTRAARLRLPSTVRRKNGTIGQADPVYVRVGQGVSLGYRRNKTGGAWVMRAFNGKGGRITRNVESTEGPRLSLPVSRKGRGTKPVTHRPVPISAGLAVRLKVAVAGRARTAPLLTRPSGEPWAHSDQKKPFRRIAEAIGQDAGKVTFYALRHSSIVRQLLAGTPVRIVATAHDTSVAMIERTYSRFIADHADALLRAGMFDTEGGKAEGKVVPLLRS
jgi:hypothetical protein